MGYFTHSMGSWVWSPQARRSMFMTIPEKYKLWSVVLWSKNFEKLVRFFFEKIFSSKNFHWISEQKYFSTNIFEREKIAKCWYFRDFFSRKCGSKKYFCSEIQWKIFEENMFFEIFFGPTFRNFWNIAPHSKVSMLRGWSWTATCRLVGTKLNFLCCALNIPDLIE